MQNKLKVINQTKSELAEFMDQIQQIALEFNEKLNEMAIDIEAIEEEGRTELEKALLKLGKKGVNVERMLRFFEDGLLRFPRKNYILIFCPTYEEDLLLAIGNSGFHVGDKDNYKGFKFDAQTDPRFPIPEEITDDVKKYLPTGFENELSIVDGLLVFKPEHKEKVKKKYGKYLSDVQDTTATIKPKTFIDFLTYMGKNGYFIYDQGPYSRELFIDEEINSKIKMGPNVKVKNPDGSTDIVDYSFQKTIVNQMPNHRHVTVALKTQSGKTLIVLRFLETFKEGLFFVLVDSDMARSQWKTKIKKWTPHLQERIIVETYEMLESALKNKKNELYHKIKDTEFTVMIYDEGERAFSDTWSICLSIKSLGRIFTTATPYPPSIEDEIIRKVVFGRMIAVDWQSTMEAQKKEYPTVVINILNNEKEKMARFLDHINNRKETLQLVFAKWKSKEGVVTGFDLARKSSKVLEKKIAFIHGQTQAKDRLELLLDTLEKDSCVITTLANRSVSMETLETLHIYNPQASENLQIQQIGRFGRAKNKEVQIYFLRSEIEKEKNKKWLSDIQTKGYPIRYPDGRPKLDVRSSTYDQFADSFIGEFERNLTTEQKQFVPNLHESTVSAAAPVKDLETFFAHPIVDETLNELKAKKPPRLNLTLDIVVLYQEKDTWTQDEIMHELGLNSKGNISTALGNLTGVKLVFKDSSKKPTKYKLNINGVNDLIIAKEKRLKRAARRKKLEPKKD